MCSSDLIIPILLGVVGSYVLAVNEKLGFFVSWRKSAIQKTYILQSFKFVSADN